MKNGGAEGGVGEELREELGRSWGGAEGGAEGGVGEELREELGRS